MFVGNVSWRFVSPGPSYRPGPRTAQYERKLDHIPLEGDQEGEQVLDGRLTGISAAGLGVAIAIADELDRKS